VHALLIHGAGGGGWEWNVWRRVFEAHGIAAITFDLQPHADGIAATRWSDYVAQTQQAAMCLPAARVLVGASLGGLLALQLATTVAAHALVLVNPLPPRPEAQSLPVPVPEPAVIPWRRRATLTGTRRALPDADAAACIYAYRRWRDESGAVLSTARAGIACEPPHVPVLVLGSAADDDVPVAVSRALALRLDATFLQVSGSHAGALLGRDAALHARHVLRWLSAR
jgi:pimeloyl-ACP methyl ester carboxylesterase